LALGSEDRLIRLTDTELLHIRSVSLIKGSCCESHKADCRACRSLNWETEFRY